MSRRFGGPPGCNYAAFLAIRRRSAGEGAGLRPHWISRRIRAGPCSTTAPCVAAGRIVSLRVPLLIFVVISIPPFASLSVGCVTEMALQCRLRDHAFF